MEKRVISAQEFFGKALEVVAKEFAEEMEKNEEQRIPVMFGVLSQAMENLTIIWNRIAKKRDDGLYEFAMDEFDSVRTEIIEKVTHAAMTVGDDREFGLLYSMKTLAANAIIRKIGKAIAGESDDSDD